MNVIINFHKSVTINAAYQQLLSFIHLLTTTLEMVFYYRNADRKTERNATIVGELAVQLDWQENQQSRRQTFHQ